MNLILKAAAFARQAHDGPRRKYNDRPYVQHPARVAGPVAARPQATEVMVAAAFLHDVVRLLADVIGDADPDLKAELLDCVQKLEAVSESWKP